MDKITRLTHEIHFCLPFFFQIKPPTATGNGGKSIESLMDALELSV